MSLSDQTTKPTIKPYMKAIGPLVCLEELKVKTLEKLAANGSASNTKLDHCSSYDKQLKNENNENLREKSMNMDDQNERSVLNSKKTIADRLAALQNNGNNDWKRRIQKQNSFEIKRSSIDDDSATAIGTATESNGVDTENIENVEFNPDKKDNNENEFKKNNLNRSKVSLSSRKDQLQDASNEWKKRIETSDAQTFSVSNRLKTDKQDVALNSSLLSSIANNSNKLRKNRNPQLIITGTKTKTATPATKKKQKETKAVIVKADNETFTSFYNNLPRPESSSVKTPLILDDFDLIRRETQNLPVQKRNLKLNRKHLSSGNPIKLLANRSDICNEYTEVITGIADQELKRLRSEHSIKNTKFTEEALAGLASTENYQTVILKDSSQQKQTHQELEHDQEKLLILIKGRRHVQSRLIEPNRSNLNSGDCFLLITKTEIFQFLGKYSNIIEQRKCFELTTQIIQNKEFGCTAKSSLIFDESKDDLHNPKFNKFWNCFEDNDQSHLEFKKINASGSSDEDFAFESSIIKTNLVYEWDSFRFVLSTELSGRLTPIEILSESKIFIFDFGSEFYIWIGKHISNIQRKAVVEKAMEIYRKKVDYTKFAIDPLNIPKFIGVVEAVTDKNEAIMKERPQWSLLAKVPQNMESILLREKFLNWPNFSIEITVPEYENLNFAFSQMCSNSSTTSSIDVAVLKSNPIQFSDFELEGSHLGRGTRYYDPETLRTFEIRKIKLTVWKVKEFDYEELPEKSYGQFFDQNNYIIRWQYRLSVIGNKFRNNSLICGRERFAYFYWQGRNAAVDEKGATALLTVQLNREKAPQVQINQGYENAVFLNLFEGFFVIHSDNSNLEINTTKKNWSLYMCRGDFENEAHLLELPFESKSFRSRNTFLIINLEKSHILIWYGCKATESNRQFARQIAEKIRINQNSEFRFYNESIAVTIDEIDEGAEDKIADFPKKLFYDRSSTYFTLLNNKNYFEFTPRLYQLSSTIGQFHANEISSPYASDKVNPFPFLQCDLYDASQPTFFLLDNYNEVWLWQGSASHVTTGSENDEKQYENDANIVRWEKDKKLALETALNYSLMLKEMNGLDHVPANLVFAGLEPLEFINIFPFWTFDSTKETNVTETSNGEICKIDEVLKCLNKSTYALEVLFKRPLPNGVDPLTLEKYLNDPDFESCLGMSRPSFLDLPIWKQIELKKKVGLF